LKPCHTQPCGPCQVLRLHHAQYASPRHACRMRRPLIFQPRLGNALSGSNCGDCLAASRALLILTLVASWGIDSCGSAGWRCSLAWPPAERTACTSTTTRDRLLRHRQVYHCTMTTAAVASHRLAVSVKNRRCRCVHPRLRFHSHLRCPPYLSCRLHPRCRPRRQASRGSSYRACCSRSKTSRGMRMPSLSSRSAC
jgi:hypothetical protein